MATTISKAGMAAGLSGMGNEAKLWHSPNAQRGDKNHDTTSNETHCNGDVGGGGGEGGGGGGDTRGDEDNTNQHIHYNGKKKNHHHHQQSLELADAYRLVPPDGGWGWMIALGTFMITTLLPMMTTSFSVLFAEYLLDAGTSSTTTAWILNLQTFLFNTSALLVRPLTQEFGWRRLALTSSAMAAAGLMISAFSPSPSFLFFSFSLLTGLGGGVVTYQCFIILPHYFQRRLGLATGIMMSGISMGQMLAPPFIRYLQVSYAFKGATLIIGAVVLNACVGASIFQPFEWHQKRIRLEEELQEETPAFHSKAKPVDPTDLTHEVLHSPSETSFSVGTAEGEIKDSLVLRERLLKRLGGRNRKYSSSSSIYSSTASLSSFGVESFAAPPVEEGQREEGRRAILPVRVVRSLITDLGSVKSLRVCILCLGNTMCVIGYINFIMMVPFAMLEAGISLDASAWCLSLSAGCNMVTRFLASTLSDWPWVNKRLVYVSGFALIASSILAFTFVSSMDGLIVAMVVYGIGVGANKSIYSLVVIDVMGVDRLSPVLGISGFFVAIGFISIGPFLGFIRDVTQSYAVSIRITGGLLLVSLTGWLFMGLAERVDRRREDANGSDAKDLEE